MIKIVKIKAPMFVKYAHTATGFYEGPTVYEIQTGLHSNEAAAKLNEMLTHEYSFNFNDRNAGRPGALNHNADLLVEHFRNTMLFANNGRSQFGLLANRLDWYSLVKNDEYVTRSAEDGQFAFYAVPNEGEEAILNIIRAMFGIYLFEVEKAINERLECIDPDNIVMKMFVAMGLKTTCDVEIKCTENVDPTNVIGIPLNPFEQTKCKDCIIELHKAENEIASMIEKNGRPAYNILRFKSTKKNKDSIYVNKLREKVFKIIELQNEIMSIK